MRLFQVNLTVADFPQALRFYRDQLDFPIVDIDPGPPAEPLVNWAMLDTGHAVLEIYDVATYGDREQLRDANRAAVQLCFLVEDIAGTHARLRAAGVAMEDIFEEQWGRYARFDDLEGNHLQIYEIRSAEK